MQIFADKVVKVFTKFLYENDIFQEFTCNLLESGFKINTASIKEYVTFSLAKAAPGNEKDTIVELIFNSFDWMETDEGDDFWYNMNSDWENLALATDFTIPGSYKNIWEIQ